MSGFARRAVSGCALAVALVVGGLAPAAYSDPPDFASPGEAWNVLPPGESGNNPPNPNSLNQALLYDGLTPLFDQVTDSDLPNFFKPNIFGLGGETPASVVQPRPGLRIERDSKGVAHVFGDTRADVMYGAGWVTVEDRDQPGAPLMEALRGPGRVAALDVPGIDPFSLVFSGRQFTPSAQTEAFLAQQVSLLQSAGPEGQQVVQDIDDYLQGVNDKRSQLGVPGPAWTRNDVVAVASLIGARFGKGGGDEARRAQFLSALQGRLGDGAGRKVFDDLREQNDPEHYVSVPGRFKLLSEEGNGNAVIDAGSIGSAAAQAAATAQSAQASASNALLLGASRSQNGHPLFVAGPQTGYTYPEILYEADLHGGGIDARGTTFPGSGPYVEIGRGQDFSWSATSSGTDIIDQYVETLCGGSDTKYVFNGNCVDMTTFNAGTLGPGPGPPAGPVTFKETVHGPVSGYARSNGERVAISNKRSTRGREVVSAHRVRGPEQQRRPRPGELRQRHVQDRVHVQLVLRGQPEHRDVLEWPRAGSRPWGRPRPADRRDRRLRVERVLHGGPAPAGGEPERGQDSQLEQQAGGRVDRRRRRVGLRLRAPRRAPGARGRAQEYAFARIADWLR